MKLFSSKLFISFLILTILFYGVSIKKAEAGGVVNALENAADAVKVAVAPLIIEAQHAVGSLVAITYSMDPFGTALTADYLSCDVNVVFKCKNDGSGGAGGGNGVGVSSVGSGAGGAGNENVINTIPSDSNECGFEISSNFYIPYAGASCGQAYEQANGYKDHQIAVYRFTLPASSNNLNSWFLNDLKNQVGNGWLNVLYNAYWWASDAGPIATLPSSICSGNTCPIKDISAPEDSYIVYAAKLTGTFGAEVENPEIRGHFDCSYNANKFLNINTPSSGVEPPESYRIGNMFAGPYKTGSCLPTVDLKINGTDGYDMNYPNTNAQLKWTTIRVSNVLGAASGDWSGSKAVSGTEELGKLTRGTSKPGQGKKYTYNLSYEPIYKSSIFPISDTVSVTVFKKPDCIFSANPSIIEVLPATSTLSWDCRYVGGASDEGSDSCSINQGIGDVNPVFGSVDVRPDKETTYTLTCNAIDGSKDYQASVNIGFKPRVYEVTPSY